ncbi:hypothetical protein TNCV_1297801 [Trichonephila clavipes]|nr:hypothetical protein TNCV_1297801 [Trichonephila clavipes]
MDKNILRWRVKHFTGLWVQIGVWDWRRVSRLVSLNSWHATYLPDSYRYSSDSNRLQKVESRTPKKYQFRFTFRSYLRRSCDIEHACSSYARGATQVSGVPITIRSFIHDQQVDRFFVSMQVHPTTTGNGSQMATSSWTGVHETFRSPPSKAHGFVLWPR